jgi:hypothetical protein
MPQAHRRQIVNPDALSASERHQLALTLFKAHTQIFDGPDAAEFERYVLNSSAERTRIEIYFDELGEAVGYFALHSFHRTLEDRNVLVHRAETGLLPAYRGRAVCARFFATELAKQLAKTLLTAPRTEHFFMGCLVHPSSYCGLSRHVDVVWPNPDRATPEPIAAFMIALGDDFNLPKTSSDDPCIRKVGWITRDTGTDRRSWSASTDPRVRMFLSANPTYRQGTGLLTIIPLNVTSLLKAFSRNVALKLRRRLNRSTIEGRAVLVDALQTPSSTRHAAAPCAR